MLERQELDTFLIRKKNLRIAFKRPKSTQIPRCAGLDLNFEVQVRRGLYFS